VEMVNMKCYTNLAYLPHTLTIINRSTKHLVLKKKFDTEHDAISYLNEAREFQNNKDVLSFTITGPNMFYSV
tara:strand:+ start:196 stop:411 length:216 start_codon:yes stop_codon:yes gene_type:complete